MEDKKVVELIEALDRADECRKGSAVDAVCVPCWYDVTVALDVVRKVHFRQLVTRIPPV